MFDLLMLMAHKQSYVTVMLNNCSMHVVKLWPAPHNVLRQRPLLHYFSREYYQALTATHLPTPEGWNLEG